jgi:hypothetical protein
MKINKSHKGMNIVLPHPYLRMRDFELPKLKTTLADGLPAASTNPGSLKDDVNLIMKAGINDCFHIGVKIVRSSVPKRPEVGALEGYRADLEDLTPVNNTPAHARY